MSQSKERHTEYMREKRQGSQGGSQNTKVHSKGSQDWETISIKDIKELLPEDIVTDIIALGEYDRIRERSITLEGRFRLAYKYQVWHDENFIDGIHRGSKYRQLAEVT